MAVVGMLRLGWALILALLVRFGLLSLLGLIALLLDIGGRGCVQSVDHHRPCQHPEYEDRCNQDRPGSTEAAEHPAYHVTQYPTQLNGRLVGGGQK